MEEECTMNFVSHSILLRIKKERYGALLLRELLHI